MSKQIHFLLLAVVAIAVAWPRTSDAQYAPTGAHYAGRASDTGGGGPGGNGSYAQSIPLDLPPSRAGVPLPVQIVSGGRQFGAAGLGWDVPLSFVHVDRSFAHRRPAMRPAQPISARERVSLSLLGRQVEMLPQQTPQGPRWIGRNAADLVMQSAGSTWIVYDGDGFTYTFTQAALLAGTGGSSGGGLWLLRTIKGPGGATVLVTHEIKELTVASSPAKALLIDLTRIEYNRHPSAGCYKNSVELGYLTPTVTKPRSLTVMGNRVLARNRRLSEVDVMSRTSCAATPQRLRRYSLSYAIDPDTQHERLSSVSVSGRQSTAEQNVSLPIAEYSYGTATTPTATAPVLRYFNAGQPIVVPTTALAADTPRRVGQTRPVSAPDFQPPPVFPSTAKSFATTQNFIDVTGDGRPDLVYRENGKLVVARNVPGAGGSTTLTSTGAPFNDNTFTRPVMDAHVAMYDRSRPDFSLTDTTFNPEDTWTQTIDVNGDGRLDIIDAAEKPYYWIVYLNTPDPGPSGIKWVRRAYDVTKLHNELVARSLFGNESGFFGYVPLSRRTTGRDYGKWTCWRWNSTLKKYVVSPDPVSSDPTAACYVSSSAKLSAHAQQTWTEWELRDINGDNYPDVVFNTSPVRFKSDGPPPTKSAWQYATEETFRLRPDAVGNSVLAMFNVRGLFISTDAANATPTDPFSTPHVLMLSAPCGVGRWQTGNDHLGYVSSEHVSKLECGFADINGDSLADRIDGAVVLLGTGTGFNTVRITLPASLGRQENTYKPLCKPPAPTQPSNFYVSEQALGLRDVTGDGVPDFIERYSTGSTGLAYRVHVGTGAGFTPPIAVEGAFEISRVDEHCDGFMSDTNGGLYDVDADGVPERVTLIPTATGHWAFEVWKLRGGSGVGTPDGGRLVGVKNGYGATTSISYRSAKEDATTSHQVPSPEVVVSAVETTGGGNGVDLGGSLAKTQFAYGNTSMFYDSQSDRFRSAGYLRRVSSTTISGAVRGEQESHVTVTDSYAFVPVTTLTLQSMSDRQKFGRYLLPGRAREVTTLAGPSLADPWAVLALDLTNDSRRIAGVRHDIDTADARLFTDTVAPTNDVCKDIMFPYEFDSSVSHNTGNYNPCTARGFLFTKATLSWRGSAAPPSSNNVQTLSSVRSVDDYGRVTSTYEQNDAFRTDDDYCVDVTYAVPTGTAERVLGAVATRKVWSCGPEGTNAVFGEEAFQYDKLLVGVSQGRVTAHTIYRHATDTGAYLSTLREYDVDYDANANPWRVTKVREDGATRITTTSYDEFGLVPVQASMSGTGVPTLTTTITIDPLTMAPLASTDENGTTRGRILDGFGRATYDTIQGPGGTPSGVTAAYRYFGFAVGETSGRSVEAKGFVDPVAQSQVLLSEGRVRTTFMDELGRTRFGQLDLGDDYANAQLIVGSRSYDRLGRVVFEADPYPTTQSALTAYGTTRYYATDGSPLLAIRGYGKQPFTTSPDPSTELFPSVSRHTFANFTETVSTQDANALMPTSPHYGTYAEATVTAVGRVLTRSTWQNTLRLDHAQLAYDRFGKQTRMIRYQNPGQGSNTVDWTWQFDSLGQLLRINEYPAAPQERTFSDFGELKTVTWTLPVPEPARTIHQTFDAYGRVLSHEEREGNVTNPETVRQYVYDVPGQSPLVSPTHVLGRLATASAPTGDIVFSYDGLGNLNARNYNGIADGAAYSYVERHATHADGSPQFVELQLPDNNYRPERMEYAYDSAGHMRWMWFSDGVNTEEIYNASLLDVWGRVRSASLGGVTQYTGNYADVGRRLQQKATVATPSDARSIVFASYDAVDRELGRREQVGGVIRDHFATYDSMGRLNGHSSVENGTTTSQWIYEYDGLGNVQKLYQQNGSQYTQLAYDTADRDRLCRVDFSGFVGLGCNVIHDSFGNLVQKPTPTGHAEIDYFTSGDVRTIKNETGLTATFRYSATGELQDTDIFNGSNNLRRDRRYGPFIKKRLQTSPFGAAKYTAREFAGPGITVSRRGATGPWVYQFNDGRGTRWTADKNGTFLQQIEYSPYGDQKSTGVLLGDARFTSDLWNGGDALEGFGLVVLGARIYDPALGRFLSRDPLLIARTSTTSNPYAFAFNDPINFSDPTGLDPSMGISAQYGGSDSTSDGTLASVVAAGIWLAAKAFAGGSDSASASGPAMTVEQIYAATTPRPDNQTAAVLALPAWAFDQRSGAQSNLPPAFQYWEDLRREVLIRSTWSWEKKLWADVMDLPVVGRFFSAGVDYRAGNFGSGTSNLLKGGVEIAEIWLGSKLGPGGRGPGGGGTFRMPQSLGGARHQIYDRLEGAMARHGGQVNTGPWAGATFPSRRAARQAASEIAGDMGKAETVQAIRTHSFRFPKGTPNAFRWKKGGGASNGVIGRSAESGQAWYRDDLLGHPEWGMGSHVNVYYNGIELHLFY